VRCPLPDHAYASCQVYAEAEQGWWCFGCARGGHIYDLASLLLGGPWGASCAARRSGPLANWSPPRSPDPIRRLLWPLRSCGRSLLDFHKLSTDLAGGFAAGDAWVSS
jgi:hypothetical protein